MMRSSLAEGLEDISEDEQLRRLLEMSRQEYGGAPSSPPPMFGAGSSPPLRYGGAGALSYSPGEGGSSPVALRRSSRTSSPPCRDSGGSSSAMNLSEWRAMSTEERMLLFRPPSRNRDISPPHYENDDPDVVVEDEGEEVDDIITIDNDGLAPNQSDDEEFDEDLKRVIEQSKYQTLISDEEKTKLIMEESLKEFKINQVGRFKVDEVNHPNDEHLNNELETAIMLSIAEGLMTEAGGREAPDGASAFSVIKPTADERVAKAHEAGAVESIGEPSKTAKIYGARPRSQPIPSPITPSHKSLDARRRNNSISSPSAGSPRHASPLNLGQDLLSDEDAQLALALKLSKGESSGPRRVRHPSLASPGPPSPRPSDFPPLATSSYSDQLAWALEASREAPQEPSPQAGLDTMLSVLSPEEQVELALRLSTNGEAPAAQARPLQPLQPRPVAGIQPLQARQLHPVTGLDWTPVASRLASPARERPAGLRLVVIDGCNVAMAHGMHRSFSVRGLVLAYEYFRERGNEVAIFLPRKKWTFAPPEDQEILTALEQTKILFLVQNNAYDDKFIIKHADTKKGIILSNDRYRDVLQSNPEFSDQIRNRTIQFTWVNDDLMIADDPMGRDGPSLDQLLKH